MDLICGWYSGVCDINVCFSIWVGRSGGDFRWGGAVGKGGYQGCGIYVIDLGSRTRAVWGFVTWPWDGLVVWAVAMSAWRGGEKCFL